MSPNISEPSLWISHRKPRLERPALGLRRRKLCTPGPLQHRQRRADLIGCAVPAKKIIDLGSSQTVGVPPQCEQDLVVNRIARTITEDQLRRLIAVSPDRHRSLKMFGPDGIIAVEQRKYEGEANDLRLCPCRDGAEQSDPLGGEFGIRLLPCACSLVGHFD